jgi:hypothetical protein
MEIAAVEQCDFHQRVFERLRGIQAAESPSKNNNPVRSAHTFIMIGAACAIEN